MCYVVVMRSEGSVRHATYYKVQVWEERSFAWKDIQRSYPTEADARAAFPVDVFCRVMEISESGRHPLA
jgi:hypothetical protein